MGRARQDVEWHVKPRDLGERRAEPRIEDVRGRVLLQHRPQPDPFRLRAVMRETASKRR